MTLQIDHTDRRVLITAGARGIGRAMAQAFSSLGAHVLVTDIDADAVEEARSAGISAILADAASIRDAERVAREAESVLGGLDVLVNNAGVAGPTAGIEDVSLEEFEQTLRVDLTGTWIYTKTHLPLLRAAADREREPSIITMTSIAGIRGAPQRTPYVAAKWGIVGLTKSLARELGPHGIRINAIAPGIIAGPRIDGVIERKAAALGRPLDDVRREYIGQADLGRMPTPEDVAHLAVFVTSRLGRNIHGQVLSVDGNIDRII